MSLRKMLTRQVFLLGAFAVMTRLAAAQIPSPALLITYWGKEMKDEKGLAIADPGTGKVVRNLPLKCPGWPHLVAVSSDRKLAFVSINFYAHDYKDPNQILNGYISVIDLAALKEIRCVELGPDSVPHGLFFAGGKLYVTAEGYQLIERYDPASDKIDWRMGMSGMGGHWLAINKEITKIFTASSVSDVVTVLEPWDHQGDRGNHATFHPWMQTVIPVGKGPEGITMSPDEKEVWTAGRRDGSLSIIDVASKKVSQTLSLEIKDPVRLKFTPDGKRVLISDNQTGDVLIYDAASRKQLNRIKKVGMDPHDMAFPPDSSRAYVSAHDETHVAIIDLKKLELVGRISTSPRPEGLAWVETRY